MDELTQLALDAGAGDLRARADLVRRTQAEVWRLCANLVDHGVADDLTQETFERALRSLPGFRARSSVRTWLLSIARRTCADEIRRRTRQRAVAARVGEAVLAGGTPEADGVPPLTGRVEVVELLGVLSPERREAFVVTQLLGLSYLEAASVCGCPVGTIRSRVARARDDLLRCAAETTRRDGDAGLHRHVEGFEEVAGGG